MGLLKHPGAIAIIGMAGRFPGARHIEQFRINLEKGVESITFFSDEELLAQGVPLSRLKDPNYVKAAPLLDDYDLFDASFFSYSPRDAELMDPQHRLLLECAWEALENAGYAPRPNADHGQRNRSSRQVGVFAGAGGLMSSYLLSETHFNHRLSGATGSREHIGNDKDYLSTRVSYKLNLQGPSLTVQTACSTSLVAVHLACQSLLNGECDMALAGGVSIRVPQRIGYMWKEGDIFSPDGHCRPFDADSQGTIFGSGVGLVVLKPLEDAIRDGDSIDAVIRGSAINNDGGQKVSYWATLAEGQADAISQALAVAEVEPETIGYVETHGTGTYLGDPVEILALSKAFGSREKQFCAIGSVKSNIGHLEAASGVAGLIKAVLSLKHKKFYPSLHFSTPNPRIKFEKTPFFVNTTLSEWPTTAFPRRAAVNSLGIGGTNAHLIVEEAAVLPQSSGVNAHWCRPLHLLTLSAKTPEALQALLSRYRQHIAAQPAQSFADLCYTANTGRVHFEHRFALRAASSEEALEALDHALNQPDLHNPLIKRGQVEQTERPRTACPLGIAFLFTGQGSQYVQMGRELYESEPIFRQTLERCNEILRPHLDHSLLSILYPEIEVPRENRKSKIHQTAYTQPALFAVEYALAELWKSWGIQPDIVMGHSVGEYVAACVAGVFSLEDGLKLVAARGRLMQELPHASRGAMVAIFASEAEVEEVLAAIEGYVSVSIAAINGPQSVVISGTREVVHAIAQQFERQAIRTQELNVSHAFHSSLMEPMLDKFRQVAEGITYHKPKLPFVSNVTGHLANSVPFGYDDVTSPAYWVDHVRKTVRFADGVRTLQEQDINIFLEVGPKPTLLGMARRCLPANYGTWLPSLRQSGGSAWAQLLNSLAELYVRGAKIDWFGFDEAYASRRQRLHLPTYPFQRKRYWLESRANTSPDVEGAAQKQGAYHARRVHLSPLIDKLMQLPRHKEIVCETTFSVTRLPFLADHRVFGEIISPGACQLAMVLEAAQLAYPQETRKQGAHWVLVDTVLPQPLLLADADAERTVQVVFRSPSAGREAGIAFELISFIAKASFGAAEQADESLQIHASGTLTSYPSPPLLPSGPSFLRAQGEGGNGSGEISVDLASLQRRCPVAVDLELFDAHAAAQQVHYGPSFRWLAEVWRGEGEVIARLRLPTALSQFDTQRGEYQLHPALLAACLRITDAVKLSSKEALTRENSEIYMPFALDSFKLLGEIKGGDWWCHTELVDEEQWHIRLMDEAGTVLAQIEGYSERKASGQLFLGGEARPEWFYEVQWQPQVRFFLPPTYLPNLTTLSQVVQREGAKSLTAPTVQQQIVALRELDALAVDYILEAFAKAGVRFKAGSEWQSQELARQLGVIPTYRRLLSRLLQILSEAAILRPIPERVEGWQVLRTPQLRSPQDELEGLRRKYGALIEAEGDLLARCANNLSAVLQGRQEPLELLFPNGDATLVKRIYQDSPIALAMNRMLQEAVKSALSQLPAGQGVRILEIGAGTGGTTAGILPLLPSGQTDYLFTDIGATFLLAAQKKFADYPFVRYQRLDIEQSPAEQGLELYQYDIVIAANVLHATADLSTTLAHVQTLLKPGGLLLLLETTTPANRVDLTFGLTDGWWRFTDHELRPDYPLLSAKKWCDLLSDTQRARCSGFSQASAIPLDEEDQTLPPQNWGGLRGGGQVVILAKREPERVEQAVQQSFPQRGQDKPGHWLILADQTGIAQQISRYLSDRGQECTLVFLGEAYQAAKLLRDQKREREEFTLSNTRADFERLLREIGTSTNAPLRGVIHCWSLDATAEETSHPEQLELATEQGCGSALYLAQALLKKGVTPALWLITQGAQAVAEHLPEEGLTGVIHSTLWGLGKVIALEHPELHCKLVDLEPLMSADESEAQVEALVEQLLATVCPLGKEPFPSQSWGGLRGGVESQLAFRQGQWYVPRLLPLSADGKGEQLREGAGYRADATYLIVGGTRGIGFKIAQWMVEQGAKNLVLVGRHAPDAATQEVIDAVVAKSDGLQVRVAQADLSKKEQIANVLTEIEQTMPPLRGIIHSAGVFDERLVWNHEWELFRKVFAPKVAGTWNLHTLTKTLPLDFFVLFSSTASLLGLAGLSNYAAANAFLDAFAHHRHALGLPALSINWGAWKEVGMAATVGKERERQWEMMGFAQMAPQQALAAFEEALKRDMPQVGIFPITWSKFLSDQGTNRHFSFFEAFRQDLQTETTPPFLPSVANPQGRGEPPIKTETNVRESTTLRAQLDASIEGKRYSLLAAHVKTVVMEILGLEPTTLLSRRQGFFELGMDSLMTIEFRNRLQLTLEMDLPSTLLFKYSTLGTLIDYLADVLGIELRDAPRGTIPKEHAVTDAPAKESGSEPIDDLDNATADKLARLESLLKEI